MTNFQIKFSNKVIEFIKTMSRDYTRIFVEKSYYNNIRFWIRRYIYSYLIFTIFLHHIKPKTVTVVGPYKPWLYAATRDLSIYTKELQYAAIESNHPAYDFILTIDSKQMKLFMGFLLESELEHRKYKFSFMENKFAVENINNIKRTGNLKKSYDYIFIPGTIGEKMVKLQLPIKKVSRS